MLTGFAFQVYSCGYQQQVLSFLDSCSLASTPIPYWPAPDNAPDSCSCNYGSALNELQDSVWAESNCTSSAAGADAYDPDFTPCTCCGYSAAVSTLNSMCPGVNLSDFTNYYSTFDFDTSCSNMDLTQCSTLMTYEPPSSTFYSPNNLPDSGNETPSPVNTGTSITSPISGSVVMWTEPATTIAISAVSGSEQAEQASGSAGQPGQVAASSSSSNSKAAHTVEATQSTTDSVSSTNQPTSGSSSSEQGKSNAGGIYGDIPYTWMLPVFLLSCTTGLLGLWL
ncbi:hypothetical protein K431DRAFT_316689 [Polychaeton citri CBS 116435]|uniref:Uncharacterized protein n=1 Tax=Polychaeton citri CBS 116435 TaxID=1314669 RepID=A0A9P4PYM0_9PEZI|nr:hypothetical protein K431DRAFT_316689 [Polychaeton citri CBS 116435]